MENGRFLVQGNKALRGAIAVAGSKNGIIPALAASLLFNERFQCIGLPNVRDVASLQNVMRAIGIGVTQTGTVCELTIPKTPSPHIPMDEARKTRGSIAFSGTLLGRTGFCVIPREGAGGCQIGARAIDFYLTFYRALGATVTESHDAITCVAPPRGLQGTSYTFPRISVVGTVTAALTAVFAKGETTLYNCALEPEAQELLHYLGHHGVAIHGLGSRTLRIQGMDGALLTMRQPFVNGPDRIETASLLLLALLCGSDVRIQHCMPEHIQSITSMLISHGATGIQIGTKEIRVTNPYMPAIQPMQVKTEPYPHFPTDVQTPLLAFLTQVNGVSDITETIFEGRVQKQCAELSRFGATFLAIQEDRVQVAGGASLHASEATAIDIRAGFACLLAALCACGTSVIHNARMIERGYDRLEERLQALGAQVERVPAV